MRGQIGIHWPFEPNCAAESAPTPTNAYARTFVRHPRKRAGPLCYPNGLA
jgi:hypothetical protein